MNRLDVEARGSSRVGQFLERIGAETNAAQKGRLFELLARTLMQSRVDFQVRKIWSWSEWPERLGRTGLDAADCGIDLVAQHLDGSHSAVQCKFRRESGTIRKAEIDSFLSASSRSPFDLRYLVVNRPVSTTTEKYLRSMRPAVKVIDLQRYSEEVLDGRAEQVAMTPWPEQRKAIDMTIEGFRHNDRGRLIMACGTGKTFTSLRIAETLTRAGGRILFLAPSIALVGQARRVWLAQTNTGLDAIAVCSDSTVGHEMDISTLYMECGVESDPERIAAHLKVEMGGGGGYGGRSVIFCTYQSLDLISAAQQDYDAPAFDLVVCDEAHRTCGLSRKGEARAFQKIHDDRIVRCRKRLYMTATPRLYTRESKSRMVDRGLEVRDMNDHAVFGPEFYRLSFTQAVGAGRLCDYRLVVLGVDRAAVGQTMVDEEISFREQRGVSIRNVHEHVTRAFGTVLAINGHLRDESGNAITAKPLRRVIGFSNTRRISERFADILQSQELQHQIPAPRAETLNGSTKIVSQHLDARDSAHRRAIELAKLRRADEPGTCRVLCNVGLFSEGVDVPALDAISFLEPRKSSIDIVQAVGRVMRRAGRKELGYVIVPIVLDPGQSVIAALNNRGDGYEQVGKVLRALAAHDSRLADESLATVLQDRISLVRVENTGANAESGNGSNAGVQLSFDFEEFASTDIHAIVASASGFLARGDRVAKSIITEVRQAGRKWHAAGIQMADAVGHARPRNEKEEKQLCVTAALLVVNACLLHKRLSAARPETFPDLCALKLEESPRNSLIDSWRKILAIDYRPVFGPALQCVQLLPARGEARDGLTRLMEYADEEAETLNQLGYDHAGPLYHKVLPSAASYGAFYSKAESAMLLAGLALPKKGRDWSDVAALERLRICDPACGTGTLLMAALSRIKRLAAEACGNSLGSDASVALHKGLVENVLCGLDINKVAVQLAACNLTLGAPMTEFRRMHLYTMLHGVDDRSPARGGSIDLMIQAEDEFDLRSFIRPVAGIASSGGQRIETGSSPEFPVRNLDLIIMNPPFTANKRRNESMSLEHRKAMQVHELSVRDELMRLDPHAGTLVNANSIETFFTPLADRLLCRRTGTLAMVNPTTACTGPAARHKRVFLASRFHIEWLITSHDPSVIAFSHSTTIHETLIVAKRYRNGNRPPTKVVSLRKFPKDGAQAERLANALSDGDHKAASKAGAGAIWDWPSKFIEGGRWNAVVWSDPVLARTAESLAESAELIRLDFVARIQLPGQGCRKAYRKCTDEEAVAGSTRRAFWSVSAKLRKRIEGVPEQRITPRPNEERLAASYWQRKSHLLIAQKLNTRSGRILALWSPVASIGSMFMPLAVVETEKLHGDQAIGYEQALCAWFNSIPGLLQMLNMRASKITYPNWEPASWKSIRVPRPGNPHIGLLTEAYHRVKRLKVARLDNLMECRVRPILDAAAAKVLGVAEAEVARWRRLLAEEPTISGKPMKPHHAV